MLYYESNLLGVKTGRQSTVRYAVSVIRQICYNFGSLIA